MTQGIGLVISVKILTVAFFGHRLVCNPLRIEQRLDQIVRSLIAEREYVEFLVGRNGDFDRPASSAVRRCKRDFRDDNSALVLILPYETAEYRDNAASFHTYYDDVEICGASAGGHFKGAHHARNRDMSERAGLIVCCIEREHGGAWQAVRYAQALGKPVVNLAKIGV